MLLKLKADNKEAMLTALHTALETDEDGKLVLATHAYWCNLIGTKYHFTGNMLTDDEGDEYTERLPLDGYYAELTVKEVEPYLPLLELVEDLTPVKEAEREAAKIKRDTAQYAPITVDGLTYDADLVSYKKMTGSIGSWDTLVNDTELIAIGAVAGDKLIWVLEDDSKVALGKAQLQAVIDAIAIRTAILQAQYSEVKA